MLNQSALLTRALLRIAVAGAVLALCASCSSNTSRPAGAAQLDPVPSGEYPKVEAAEGLSRFIVVSGVEETPRTARTPMSVVVAIRSQTEYQEIEAQYRFFFFDEKNRPLQTEPDWRRIRLPSRSQVFLEGGAMETRAIDWRLQIRPAR